MKNTLAFHSSAEAVHMTQKGDSHLIHGTSNQIRFYRAKKPQFFLKEEENLKT